MSGGLSRQQLHILRLAQRNHRRFRIGALAVNSSWRERASLVDAVIRSGGREGVPLYAHEIMHKVYGITLHRRVIRREAAHARSNRRYHKAHPDNVRTELWFCDSFRARLADCYGKYDDDPGRRACASASMSRALRSLQRMGLAAVFHGHLFLTDAGLRVDTAEGVNGVSSRGIVNGKDSVLTEGRRRHTVNGKASRLTKSPIVHTVNTEGTVARAGA